MSDAKFEDADDGPLRLYAETADDLPVIASLAQDAVIQPKEMAWMSRQRRMAVLMNRFRWEDADAAKAAGRPLERVQSLLVIENVLGVRSSGVDPKDEDTVLSLIGISFAPGEDASGEIDLIFSGDGTVRLAVECLDVSLKDVSRPYQARAQQIPSHPE